MNTTKNGRVVLILFASVAILAQPSSANRVLAQNTQSRGYWVDASTGLMWAGKDNGRDVMWKNAVKYCRDLRLAGYSDWRLATVEELKAIYDKNANAPGLMGPSGRGHPATWHVKGELFLTGNQWSSTQKLMIVATLRAGHGALTSTTGNRSMAMKSPSRQTNALSACVDPASRLNAVRGRMIGSSEFRPVKARNRLKWTGKGPAPRRH